MKKSEFVRHSSFVIRYFCAAFTDVELLVVCAIIGVLALTLGPVLARSSNSQALQCMNNHRQLCAAWRMHAEDNNGRIVYASDNGVGTAPYKAAIAGDAAYNNNAWTWSRMDFTAGNPYDWDPAADITLRPLWPYTGKDTNLYRCPSDRSHVVTTNGQAKPRVRSISMNYFLGGLGGGSGGASGVNNYQLYLKVPEISVPNKIFVLLDQSADTIQWGNYLTDMSGYPNVPGAYRFGEDLPGFYHDQSCTFSFVDGHVEEKHWLDTRTTPPPTGLGRPLLSPAAYSPDVAWLQDHATRPK